MTPRSIPGQDRLPLETLERIDQVCAQFEAAWKAGRKPRIESHLGKAQGVERACLWHELMLLDWDYRTRRGETPKASEYQTRFPEYAKHLTDIVSRVVAPAQPGPTAPTVAGSADPAPKQSPILETVAAEPSIDSVASPARGLAGGGAASVSYGGARADARSRAVRFKCPHCGHGIRWSSRLASKSRATTAAARFSSTPRPPLHDFRPRSRRLSGGSECCSFLAVGRSGPFTRPMTRSSM
jgi:predicted RNA-binding Zn-ribbon protein involved in translation (DUF1610 family)